MKKLQSIKAVGGPRRTLSAFFVMAALCLSTVLFAAIPSEDERHQIELLVGSYYRAIAAENADEVVELHHWANSFERDKVSALVRQALAGTDSEFERVRIQSIDLYPERNIGLVRVSVDFRLRNSDGSDSFSGHQELAIVLVSGHRGWRIGKVARAADLDLTAATSRFSEMSREVAESVPPASDGMVESPSNPGKLPKLAVMPDAAPRTSLTGSSAATQTATTASVASTGGGLTFFAIRQKATGQCVVVVGAEGISPGDTIYGAFPDFERAQETVTAKCFAVHPDVIPAAAAAVPGRPLTGDRLYEPDETVVRGQWGTVTHIAGDPGFARATEGGIALGDGLFAHPGNGGPTEIVYSHDGTKTTFSGTATVIDCVAECGSLGSVNFIIRGDGLELWNSGLVRHNDPGRTFTVDLEGVHDLRLITTDGGNGTPHDWAAWLDLEIGSATTPVAVPSVAGESAPATGISPILAVPRYDGDESTTGIFVVKLNDGSAVFIDRVKGEPLTFRSKALNHNIFTVFGRPLDRPAKPGEILAGEIRATNGQVKGLFVVDTSTGSAAYLMDAGSDSHRVTVRRINGRPAAAIASDDGNFALIMRRDGSGSTDGAYLYHATTGRCAYFAHIDDMKSDTEVGFAKPWPVMVGRVAAIALQNGSEATPEALLVDGGSGLVYRVGGLEHQPIEVTMTRQSVDLFRFFPAEPNVPTRDRFVLVPGFADNGATDSVFVLDSGSGRMAVLNDVRRRTGMRFVASTQDIYDYFPEVEGSRGLTAVPKVGASGKTDGAWIFDSATDEVLFLENIREPNQLRVGRVDRKAR